MNTMLIVTEPDQVLQFFADITDENSVRLERAMQSKEPLTVIFTPRIRVVFSTKSGGVVILKSFYGKEKNENAA